MDLKARATNMITKPAAEWPVVAREAATPTELLTGYAVPLSAIPAVCGFIGMTIIGIQTPVIGTIRIGVMSALANAIVQYVFGLAGVYVCAIIIEKLAPSFQSSGDTAQAMKLVVYASTPAWVAGVLRLVPLLGTLGILAGLYAIYLFYLGLPSVMHTPKERVIPYMAVSAVVVIVLSVCVGLLTAALTGVRGYGAF